MHKKLFSVLLLLLMSLMAWAGVEVSTVGGDGKTKPDHLYTLVNANGLAMNGKLGATQKESNYGQFAFYAVAGHAGAYYVYSSTENKWWNYTRQASYSNGVNFVTLSASKAENAYFKITENSDGTIMLQPYNTTGVESKYVNFYGGTDRNPVDRNTTTVGLYQNGANDNGSKWQAGEIRVKEAPNLAWPNLVAPSGKYTLAKVFPDSQDNVGTASLTHNGDVYRFSNNVLDADFMLDNTNPQHKTLYFAGSKSMDLTPGTEPFTLAMGTGTKIYASDMTLEKIEMKDINGDAKAVKGSHRFKGKALEATYSYTGKHGKLAVVWRAVLRDGSHYLITEMEITAKDGNAKMYNVIPMIYKVDTQLAGSAPQVVGNTRGAVIMSNKIFAGVEHPTAYNTVGDATGDESNYDLTESKDEVTMGTSNTWTDMNDSDVPQRMQEVLGSISNVYSYVPQTVTLKKGQKIEVTIKYTSGAHKLFIGGVEIVKHGETAASANDYHLGYAGSTLTDNVYNIVAPYDGTYDIRILVNGRAENASIDAVTTMQTNIYTPKENVKINTNIVSIQGRWSRNTTLAQNDTWKISAVIGLVAQDGVNDNDASYTKNQKRRSILAYSERERAVPWRAFPVYNSWYELNINRNNAQPGNEASNFNSAQVENVVKHWKSSLYDNYKIAPKSFVVDDGWDVYGTWKFHTGFPNGFRDFAALAKKMGSGIGAWLGPVGGYGQSGDYRRAYWANKGGMQLSNPEYYKTFLAAARELVTNSGKFDGSNEYLYQYFKFDGISKQFTSVGPDPGDTGNENAEGIIRLEQYVRDSLRSDIFFNTSVGTWASPFWYHITDATWRQENDFDYAGNSSIKRENWITYRDRLIYQNYVQNSPVCPINSIMSHGFMLSKFAGPAAMSTDYASVLRELRAAFACGTGMVELYSEYSLLDNINDGRLWKDIADLIKWQKEYADVLPDAHWVGGNPWNGTNEQVYGWASWNGTKATLALRNGDDAPQTFTTTLREALNIPKSWQESTVRLVAPFSDQQKLEGWPETKDINIDQQLTLKLPKNSLFMFSTNDFTEHEFKPIESVTTMPQLSSSDTSNEHWYYIQMQNGKGVVTAQGEDAKVTTAAASKNNINSQQWKVVKSGDKYQLINKAGQTLYYDATTSVARFKASKTPSGNNTSFYLVSSANATYPGLQIATATSGKSYLNQFGGAGIGKELGLWDTNDPNNPLAFVSPNNITLLDGAPAAVNEVSITGTTTWTPESKHTLWYTQPARTWMTSTLPIGNGQFGATLMGGVKRDEIQFNDKTLWSGQVGDLTSNAAYGQYLNFGYLYITQTSDAAATDYRRWLDIDSAKAGVSYTQDGVTYNHEYIASYPDNVVAIRYTASEPGKINSNLILRNFNGGAPTYTVEDRKATAVFKGTVERTGNPKPEPESFYAMMRVEADGGTVSQAENGIDIAGANSMTVFLRGMTNYDPSNDSYIYNADLLPDNVENTVNKAAKKGWDEVLSDHVADYKHFYDRVNLTLTDQQNNKTTPQLIADYAGNDASNLLLEEMYFNYGRYLMIASSRGVDLPSNLQGIWNNLNAAPWHSDIHANINVQMNYWPAEPTNLSELHMPFINYIYREAMERPQWRKNAKSLGGQDKGWTFTTENNIYGSGSNWMQNYTVANAWDCMHLWQHYRYTLDKDYLRTKAFPAMKSAAQYWLGRLVLATDGTYECPNEYSPEHGPQSENATAHSQQLVWDLFDKTLKAMEALGNEGEDAAFTADLKNKFAKLDKGTATEVVDGLTLLREWKYTSQKTVTGENYKNHRHLSHLMGLYPGNQINKYADPTIFKAAVTSLNARGFDGTGWSLGHKINAQARAYSGVNCHRLIKRALKLTTTTGTDQSKGGIYENLWDAHAPFQIDGNFGTTSGMAEMLLQSKLGKLEILPALPAEWGSGSVTGLRAEGAFGVDIAWKNGKASKITITSDKGEQAIVSYPSEAVGFTVTEEGGQAVSFTQVNDNEISFPTAAGKRYTITLSFTVPTYEAVTITPKDANRGKLSVENGYLSSTRHANNENNSVWGIVSYRGQQYLYNEATGTFASYQSGAQFAQMTTNIHEAAPIEIVDATTSGYKIIKLNKTQYINLSSGHNYGSVVNYNTEDDGNRLTVSPTGSNLSLEKLKDNAKNFGKGNTRWGELDGDNDAVNALRKEFAEGDLTIDNYAYFLTQATAKSSYIGSKGLVNFGHNTVANQSIGLTSDYTKVHAQTTNLADVNQLWLVTSVSKGKVRLYNPNTAKYLGSLAMGTANTTPLSDTPVDWNITYVGDNIKLGNGSQFLNYENASASLGNLNGWHDNDVWKVTEVAELPVALHAIAGKHYATLCTPFSYTLAEGTTAYTGELDNNATSVRLTAIKGKVEAGTPVILIGSSSQATVAIDAATLARTPKTGLLTGIFLPVVWNPDNLSLGSYEGNVGFYKWSGTTLSANRAYISADKLPANAKSFSIIFDETTAVSNISVAAGENKDEVIYNLAGQRVNKSYKGVVIINGKKINKR